MEEMSKAYHPQGVEKRVCEFWEKGGFFQAKNHSKKSPFTIIMPPPNVTGALHMGHALVSTLQDILVRWRRMCGEEACWIPGTDHAGIATQTVVEKHLWKTEKKRRSDFSREEFLKRVWSWKEESEKKILSQMKQLGCSCDWNRLAFSMDVDRSKSVATAFKKMFDDGLIYRGDYLVNWDPVSQTALSDDEVEYEERTSTLYYVRYPIEGSQHYLTVATVRPETLFGDTAIAVSPQDVRYQAFIGQKVKVPLCHRVIPVIADASIDPEFGTGVVKITPAHDPNDYALGEKHHLPFLNIMTPDGRLNELAGPFAGLLMEEARPKVAEALKQLDLLEKTEPHLHRVGLSYRSKAVVEPYLSKQWFVKLSAFKTALIHIVKSGQVKLIPESFQSIYFHWIHHLRDWCISRQLWWGHRIPVWYSKEDPSQMVCSLEDPGPSWEQDPDVLDTWFSSALWPFSVLGWPKETADLQKFFPTSVLVTGHDILFFWVARMMMMSQYLFEKPPFHTVFLHGLIFGKSYWKKEHDGSILYLLGEETKAYRLGKEIPPDVHHRWEKMSKSKGNILDPLEIIEIYGTDAMRMALASSTTGAQQIDLDHRRFEEFKNFANKVWNGARFVLMHLKEIDLSSGIDRSLLALEDRWILSRQCSVIQQVNAALSAYKFDQAAMIAYDFFWKEFCAYYVELTKPALFAKQGTHQQKILLVVLLNTLRLLHPIAPFITEELFQILKRQLGPLPQVHEPYLHEALTALQSPACATAAYPTIVHPTDHDPAVEEEFASIHTVVHAIRNIRAEMEIPPGSPSQLIVIAPEQHLSFIREREKILYALVRLEKIQYSTVDIDFPSASTVIIGPFKLTLPLPQAMQEKERIRIVKEQERLLQEQQKIQAQLANSDFIEKAPPHIVEKLRQTQREIAKKIKPT